MSAGETVRIDCSECDAECSITYIPEVAEGSEEADDFLDAVVGFCPFCGHRIESTE